MADTPLDLDSIKQRYHADVPLAPDFLAIATREVQDIRALVAEVETLRTQLAEAQLEATKLATEGVWDYEYGMNALVTGHFIAYNSEGEARAWVGVHDQPLMRRRRWRGPVQAVEETTE